MNKIVNCIINKTLETAEKNDKFDFANFIDGISEIAMTNAQLVEKYNCKITDIPVKDKVHCGMFEKISITFNYLKSFSSVDDKQHIAINDKFMSCIRYGNEVDDIQKCSDNFKNFLTYILYGLGVARLPDVDNTILEHWYKEFNIGVLCLSNVNYLNDIINKHFSENQSLLNKVELIYKYINNKKHIAC